MSKKGLFFTFIVLLLVFGGVVLYTSENKYFKNLNFLQRSLTEKNFQGETSLLEALPSKISTEELKKLALGPGANSSESVFVKHSEDINSVSVISDILDITNCTPTPNVLSFNSSQPITIVNRDTIVRSLAINAKGQSVIFATLNPQTQKVVWLNILGQGIYSYVCDGQGPAGIFLVQ